MDERTKEVVTMCVARAALTSGWWWWVVGGGEVQWLRRWMEERQMVVAGTDSEVGGRMREVKTAGALVLGRNRDQRGGGGGTQWELARQSATRTRTLGSGLIALRRSRPCKDAKWRGGGAAMGRLNKAST